MLRNPLIMPSKVFCRNRCIFPNLIPIKEANESPIPIEIIPDNPFKPLPSDNHIGIEHPKSKNIWDTIIFPLSRELENRWKNSFKKCVLVTIRTNSRRRTGPIRNPRMNFRKERLLKYTGVKIIARNPWKVLRKRFCFSLCRLDMFFDSFETSAKNAIVDKDQKTTIEILLLKNKNIVWIPSIPVKSRKDTENIRGGIVNLCSVSSLKAKKMDDKTKVIMKELKAVKEFWKAKEGASKDP